ncbi:MAG: Coenzyme F420 hydrogenase/dehydrogenase, beta subunit C-terminal domain [Candidatus Omnitrophota bacterium]
MNSIRDLNLDYMCVGCGACACICPLDCINILVSKGQFYPRVDENKCKKCGLCLSVCPGREMRIEEMAKRLWPGNLVYPKIGSFLKTYIGYSNNQNIRFNSASGGIATSLLIELLNEKYIDGAVVVRMNSENPVFPETFIARTVEEIESAQSSKYCPTSMLTVLKELKNNKKDEKLALVGLPCQIYAFRKLAEKNKVLSKKIILTLGLFCSHGVTFAGTQALLNKFAKGADNIYKIQWRGRGWPGGVAIKYKNKKEYFIDLERYWPPFFAPYFFTPYRCLSCSDLAAETADVSLGDAWLKEIKQKDNMGTSIVIVRSETAKVFLEKIKDKGGIFLENLSIDKVIESQQGILSRKKVTVGARMKLLKFFKKPVPQIDGYFKELKFKYSFGAFLIFLNAAISKSILFRKLIVKVPIRILRRYSGLVLCHSKGNHK